MCRPRGRVVCQQAVNGSLGERLSLAMASSHSIHQVPCIMCYVLYRCRAWGPPWALGMSAVVYRQGGLSACVHCAAQHAHAGRPFMVRLVHIFCVLFIVQRRRELWPMQIIWCSSCMCNCLCMDIYNIFRLLLNFVQPDPENRP